MTQPTRRTTYKVRGSVGPDDLYVERAADEEVLQACLRGEYANVLSSRQVGKTSLINRTAKTLRQQGISAVWLDMSLVSRAASEENFYNTFLSMLATKTRIDGRILNAKFNQQPGVSFPVRLGDCLSDVVLPASQGRLVIFLDEIDSTLTLPYRDDLFALIRGLYNQRAERDDLNGLTFVLVGATPPSALINDPRRTPFNIGKNIELTDFTFAQASTLLEGLPHEHEDIRIRLLSRVLHWTGGHPYLTVKALAELAALPDHQTDRDVDTLIERLYLGETNRSTESHFRDMSKVLLDQSLANRSLVAAYGDVLRQKLRPDPHDLSQAWLKVVGIVRMEQGVVRPRNLIYERLFDIEWVKRHLPPSPFLVRAEQWLRRNIWVGPAVAVILIAVALLAVYLARDLRIKQGEVKRVQKENERVRRQNAKTGEDLRVEQAKVYMTRSEVQKTSEEIKAKEATLKETEHALQMSTSHAARSWMDRIESADPVSAALLSVEVSQLIPNVSIAGHLLSFIDRFSPIAQVNRMDDRDGGACLLAWLPDGKSLACAGMGRLWTWNDGSREPSVSGLSVQAIPRDFVWGRSGALIAFSNRGAIQVLVGSESREFTKSSTGGERILLSPDGALLLVQENARPRLVRVFDLASRKRVAGPTPFDDDVHWAPNSREVFCYAKYPEGLRLVIHSASDAGMSRLRDHGLNLPSQALAIGRGLFLVDRRQLRKLEYNEARTTVIAEIPDGLTPNVTILGDQIAAWSGRNLYLVRSGEKLASRPSLDIGESWGSASWRPDGRVLAVSTSRAVFMATVQPEAQYKSEVQGLGRNNARGIGRVSPSVTWDQLQWAGQDIAGIGRAGAASSVRRSFHSSTIRTFNTFGEGSFPATEDATAFAIQPRGDSVAMGIAQVRDKTSTTKVLVMQRSQSAARPPREVAFDWTSFKSLHWSPNGQSLVVIGEKLCGGVERDRLRCGGLALLNASNARLQKIKEHTGGFIGADWAPDGKFVHVAEQDGAVFAIYTLNPATGELSRPLDRLQSMPPVSRASWSPGGHYLAITTRDGNISIWSKERGLWKTKEHCSEGWTDLQWHPRDNVFVSVCATKMRFVDLDAQIFSDWTNTQSLAIASLAWAPDGTRLALGSNRVELIDLRLPLLQKALCGKLPFNLSQTNWRRSFPLRDYRKTCPELPVPMETEDSNR